MQNHAIHSLVALYVSRQILAKRFCRYPCRECAAGVMAERATVKGEAVGIFAYAICRGDFVGGCFPETKIQQS